MKNQIQKLKTKLTSRGSILVYALIVMMIMLATALSIFAVAVREKKSAGTTAASMQAFAVADSGSEIALNKVANVLTLAEIGSCASGGVVTGSIGTGMDYTLTFYDSGGNQLLNCTDSVSAVDKVKSVGRYAGTARAVEVAVAGSASIDNGCIICDVPGNQGGSCTLRANKVKDENICSDEDGCKIHVMSLTSSILRGYSRGYDIYFYQKSDGKWFSSYIGYGTNGDTTTETLDGASPAVNKIWDDKPGVETSSDSIYIDNSRDNETSRQVICDEG